MKNELAGLTVTRAFTWDGVMMLFEKTINIYRSPIFSSISAAPLFTRKKLTFRKLQAFHIHASERKLFTFIAIMRNCHDERALLCAILEPADLIEGKYKSLNRMPGTKRRWSLTGFL